MTTIDQLFPRGLLRPELLIGALSSVSAQAVEFTLHEPMTSTGVHFLGGRYGRGEVGEFVLIEGQVSLLLGRIIEIRSQVAEQLRLQTSGDGPRGAIGGIQLLGSVAMDSLRVTAGVESYPRLRDRVYACPHDFVAALPRLMEPPGRVSDIQLNLGVIDKAPESAVSITPEKLFGRHAAILGTTGGGKSWTTARLIEECLEHSSKLLLLDATGEYRGFDGDHVTHVHLGSPVDTATTSQLHSLPPTEFVETDFIALFEPAGKVQGPKMRMAIRSLRMAALRKDLAPEGFVRKILQLKTAFEAAEKEQGIAEKLDDPRQPFEVRLLPTQIEEECHYPEAFLQNGPRGAKDPTRWGDPSGEFSNCLSLVSRIHAVLTSAAFECVFKSTARPLTEAIGSFMKSNKRLLRVCLSGVAYEFKAREIVANAIGRHLLNLARAGSFKKKPLIVVVDEAHNFIGRQIGSDDTVAHLDAFELVAKEGRKYGLTVCLATQRPRDIVGGVLSQMGTLIVHRLTNDSDREVVERACGEIDRSASSFLPNLKPGEAAIIGADFPIPLTIQVSPPRAKPFSDGPNYQRDWTVVASGAGQPE